MIDLSYLKRLNNVCSVNNIDFIDGLSTLEKKVSHYVQRDTKNNKFVEFFPVKQYDRAMSVIERYYR